MNHLPKNNLIIVVALLLLLCSVCEGVITLPPGLQIPAVISFGDSIVDHGNNNRIKTLISCNFPPYGKDFQGGRPTGRFTNGKTPLDLIAQELGVKEVVPAYNESYLTDRDLLTGVSFASGGCGYDPQTSALVVTFAFCFMWSQFNRSVISLSDQLEHFKEYIARLRRAVGDEYTTYTLLNSLFLVVAGSDDLANTYFTIGTPRPQYDVSSYADLLVNSASNFIRELYALGARRMAVFGLPSIGCLPSQRTIAGGAQRVCAEDRNQAAQLVNSKLVNAIQNSLNQYALPQSRVVFIDIYNPLLDLIQNPYKYGFEVNDRGCCGTGNIEVSILCNKYSETCVDRSKYIFWDSYHPTEAAYKIVVESIIQKYIYSFV